MKSEKEKLQDSIKSLENTAQYYRDREMYQAAIIYEDKAERIKARLKRWYSIKID